MDGVQVLQIVINVVQTKFTQKLNCTTAHVPGRVGGWGPGSGTCTQAVSGRSTSGEEEAAKLLPIFTILWIQDLFGTLHWGHLLM